MVAGIVPYGEQNLYHGSIMLHGELNGTPGNWPWGTAPDSIKSAARESTEFIFIETTDFGEVESEMGRDEREKEKEQCGSYDRLHDRDE